MRFYVYYSLQSLFISLFVTWINYSDLPRKQQAEDADLDWYDRNVSLPYANPAPMVVTLRGGCVPLSSSSDDSATSCGGSVQQ